MSNERTFVSYLQRHWHVISSFPLPIAHNITKLPIFSILRILHKNPKPAQYVIAHDKIRGALRDADCSVTPDDETPPTTSRGVWRECIFFFKGKSVDKKYRRQLSAIPQLYTLRYVSLCACRKTD